MKPGRTARAAERSRAHHAGAACSRGQFNPPVKLAASARWGAAARHIRLADPSGLRSRHRALVGSSRRRAAAACAIGYGVPVFTPAWCGTRALERKKSSVKMLATQQPRAACLPAKLTRAADNFSAPIAFILKRPVALRTPDLGRSLPV